MSDLEFMGTEELYDEIFSRGQALLVTYEDELSDIRHALLQNRPNEALALLERLMRWVKST